MPHVIVKLWPGRSEEKKQELAEAIAKDLTSVFGCSDESVSVSFEEVEQARWRDEVFVPDITGHPERLYKKPGYDM